MSGKNMGSRNDSPAPTDWNFHRCYLNAFQRLIREASGTHKEDFVSVALLFEMVNLNDEQLVWEHE